MSPWRRRAVMFSMCLALFLAALDITIVATALPTITRTLDASAADYAWIGSGYTLASTASGPAWARLSAFLGRKPLLVAASGVFAAGSLASALARSPGALVGGRVLQGLGGGGNTVLVSVAIGDLFPLRDRAKYYGLTGLVWAVAAGVGPILGGVFTQTISWRWCFWINLPLDGIAIVVLLFALKLPRPRVSLRDGLRSLDWVGSVTIIGGTICFLYGLESGSGGLHAWGSAFVICLMVFGVVLLVLFGFYEAAYARDPVIPTRIFRRRTNVASFATICLHSFIFITYDYFLPLYFQVVLGFSPIISGLSLFPLIIPMSAVTFGTGILVRRTGNYLPQIWFGAAMMTLGTGLFINFGPSVNWAKIVTALLIAGIGSGPLFQAPMIALQSHVLPEDVAMATSAQNFSRNLFTSTSIVIGTVLLQRTLGGETLTNSDGNTGTTANSAKYASAMSFMWMFYTAMGGVLVLTTLFIKKKDLLGKEGAALGSDNDDNAQKAVVEEKTL
ncbi:major facilitator superfamily transporter [Xylariaceae sp. FL0804]|nr:major facilitator superfamily transporter [Xylariaceae sp. FL0804]